MGFVVRRAAPEVSLQGELLPGLSQGGSSTGHSQNSSLACWPSCQAWQVPTVPGSSGSGSKKGHGPRLPINHQPHVCPSALTPAAEINGLSV